MKRAVSIRFTAIGLLSLSAAAMAGSTNTDQEAVSIIRANEGSSSDGPAENFTGKVQVVGRFQREAPARTGGATVTFEPRARTAWHTHPIGQTLIVMRGHGFVQQWQHAPQAIGPGDIAWIPPGAKHWHGASPTSAMTHVAISESENNSSVTWMELVSDAQYGDAARRKE